MSWNLKTIGLIIGAILVMALVIAIPQFLPTLLGLAMNGLFAAGFAYGAGHLGYRPWREGRKFEGHNFFFAPMAAICFVLTVGFLIAIGVRVW